MCAQMQRRAALLLALLALSCGSDGGGGDEPAQSDVCADAYRVHAEALRAAMESAPPCQRDGDCVVMADQAGCEGLVDIELCDKAVHHGVVDAYDARAVAEQICDLARQAEFGCTISASCQAHGEPVCREGACVFAAPAR
jgi:hypothetical protein